MQFVNCQKEKECKYVLRMILFLKQGWSNENIIICLLIKATFYVSFFLKKVLDITSRQTILLLYTGHPHFVPIEYYYNKYFISNYALWDDIKNHIVMDTDILCFLWNSMQLLDDNIIAFLHGNTLYNCTTHYNSIIQGTCKYNFEGILVTVEVLELCSCCSVTILQNLLMPD